jgi:hypothetical protein
VAYLKDILLDSRHAGGKEDDGEEGDAAEHAGVDAAVKELALISASQPLRKRKKHPNPSSLVHHAG